MTAKKHADPFKTRNDRTRLGPLNMTQLHELLERESRAKIRAKIRRRIDFLAQRGWALPKPAAEPAGE